MVFGLVILLLFQLVGELGVKVLNVPIPGPVLGMGLLAATLAIWGRTPVVLRKASYGLLKFMPLLFVPAGVGVLALHDALKGGWLALGVALVVSTALALAITAWVMKGLVIWMHRGQE